MTRLMTHLVVGNPSMALTKRFINEMIAREVSAIELQIPFSDPIADGPVLMKANDNAVGNGVSVDETLKLLSSLTVHKTKIYIMSYLQPILSYGASKFFEKAIELGCKGFIIPDLPFDAPEMISFITEEPSLKQLIVPVLSPEMHITRISEVFEALEPNLVYVTARHGITGDRTESVTKHLIALIGHVRSQCDARVAVGFGIQTANDVKNVLEIADLAVVGSALTSAQNESEAAAVKLLTSLVNAAEE